MEDLAGRQLGQYRIVARLGEGGMATVYRAYQPRMDRYVALKVLPRHYASDPTFVGRFEQEAKVIANLEHPSILPVHDYGEDDGYTYLVMRYVPAGTLADEMSQGPLAMGRVLQVLSQVGAALDHAHARGVIHRDIKPSNILIDEESNCFLTDFGIAKMLEAAAQLTVTGGFVGTPTYASPEQCLGRDLDGRSDIYSLGVMLYEMATGRVPFDAETPMAVAIKKLHDPLPLPSSANPELSQPLEGVILKALAREPGDRYAVAGDMVRALAAAIEAEPGISRAGALRTAPATPYDRTALYETPDLVPAATEAYRPQVVADVPPADATAARLAQTVGDEDGSQAGQVPSSPPEPAASIADASQLGGVVLGVAGALKRKSVPVWALVTLACAIVALIAVAAVGFPAALTALQGPVASPTELPTREAPPPGSQERLDPPAGSTGLGSADQPLILASLARPGHPESVPAIERVAGRVSALSGVVVRPAIVPNARAVLETMVAGQAHAGWLDALEYLAARERVAAEPVIVAVRFGSTRVRGQFLTRRDSGIAELPDVRGRVVCFGPGDSPSGSVVPRLMLRGIGIDPGRDLAGDPQLDTQRQVVLEVYHGECDAGATFVDARASVEDELPDVREVVVVLGETVEFPYETLSFAGNVPADLRERVAAAFIALLESETGRAAVAEGYGFDGLEPVDDSAFHPLREQIAAAERSG